jgi:hypothetical protein
MQANTKKGVIGISSKVKEEMSALTAQPKVLREELGEDI